MQPALPWKDDTSVEPASGFVLLPVPIKGTVLFSVPGTADSHTSHKDATAVYLLSKLVLNYSFRNHNPASFLFRDREFSILRISALDRVHATARASSLLR